MLILQLPAVIHNIHGVSQKPESAFFVAKAHVFRLNAGRIGLIIPHTPDRVLRYLNS